MNDMNASHTMQRGRPAVPPATLERAPASAGDLAGLPGQWPAESPADEGAGTARSSVRAHLVVWIGAAVMLGLVCLTRDSYYGMPTVFPVSGFVDRDFAALLSIAGGACFAAALWLLPRDRRTPNPTLARSLAYVAGGFALFEAVSYADVPVLPGTVAWIAPLGLFTIAWLEARGRRRVWFVAVAPIVVVDAYIVQELLYEWRYIYSLLVVNGVVLASFAAVTWLARITGHRWDESTTPRRFGEFGAPYNGAMSGGPSSAVGVPPQNTLAVVGFVLSFFFSVPGIVCGHIALSQIKRTGERGRGLAIAGLVIGYLGLALVIAYVVIIASLLAS